MNIHTDTRVTDYALGELDEAARLEMQTHLVNDAEASRAVAEIEKLGGLLRAALPPAAAAITVKTTVPTTNRPHRPAALWALAASIAVLVTSIGGVVWWRQRSDVQITALHVATTPSRTRHADGADPPAGERSKEFVMGLEQKVVPPVSWGRVADAPPSTSSTPLGDLAENITPQISLPAGIGQPANRPASQPVDVGTVNVFTQSGGRFAAAVPPGTFGDGVTLNLSDGNEGLVKTGSGTWEFTGGTTIGQSGEGAGVLQLGNATNRGVITYNGMISGTAGNAYTGGTTLLAGAAIVSAGTPLPAIRNPEPRPGSTTLGLGAPGVFSSDLDDPLGANALLGPYDVDNDGDGTPERVYVDLGLPITADGRLAKPLFAIMEVDLEGRIRLGAQDQATRHLLETRLKEVRDIQSRLGEQEHNTETYDAIVENAFLKPTDAPLSTFSIDVDTASYSNVRRMLNARQLPPRGAVRIEEFINYFIYDYPQPTGDDPFSVTTEAARCPWNGDHLLVRIGLKGKEIHRKERPATNLVFLVDVSGSMGSENKLPLVRESLKLLVKELGDSDRVAIVVYAGSTGLVLPSTGGDRKQTILDAIDRLSSGGSTNGGAGITLAYQTAVDNFIEGGVNRVVLATDGDFNVGVTNQDELVRLIEAKAKSGVFFSALGYGMGNLKDSTLEKLADKGNGNYAYIDTLAEARKVLVEQMSGTLVTIAKDVKVQIEFNPARVAAYRLLGYENRVLAAQDFNDDKKDAGEIGAGHTVTALYELIPAVAQRETQQLPTVDPLKYQRPPQAAALTGAAEAAELLTLKLRYKQPDGDVSKLIERPLADDVRSYAQASGDFKFAAAVTAFGMLLRHSQHRGSATYEAVLELTQEGRGRDEGGYRAEFVGLVQKARELAKHAAPER